jgi:hypothetical protein
LSYMDTLLLQALLLDMLQIILIVDLVVQW